MFIDDYGNEFQTEKEIEDFARKDFYKQDERDLFEALEHYVCTTELLRWIFENDKEKFIKDYKDILKNAENDYVQDYFVIHDLEEV